MVDNGQFLTLLLQWVTYNGPSLVMYIIGCVIASTHLTRYPRPAWLALIGCGLLAMTNLTSLLMYAVIASQGSLFGSTTIFMTALNVVMNAFHLLGFGLVFAAVFLDRRRPEPPPVMD